MKGIIINEGSPLLENKYVNACYIKNGHLQVQMTFGEEISYDLSGKKSKSTAACCNKDDTYDFETGALIALMKMCGLEKVVRACNEAFPKERYNTYIAKFEGELNELKKEYDKLGDRNKYLLEDINKKLGYLKEKDEEIEKLKSDKDKSWKNYQRNIQKKQDRINELNNIEEGYIKLREEYDSLFEEKEKLQHDYDLCLNSENALKITTQMQNKSIEKLTKAIDGYKNDLYNVSKRCRELEAKEAILNKQEETINKKEEGLSVYFGSRGNGKQYTALVDLFKKIDQKKVDAAYKEAYNTTLPVWQKEVLKQMYDIHKESKEKIELPRTLDINGTVYRKSIQVKDFGVQIKPLRPLTKREEMWGKILGDHKYGESLEVKVEKPFINDFLSEAEDNGLVWANGGEKPTEWDKWESWRTHDYVVFQIWYRGKTKELTWGYPSDEKTINYLPPMRWDLFKKGRKIVRVTPENIDDFIVKCTNKFGSIMKPVLKRYKDFTHVFIMMSDYHYDNKPTIHIMTPEDLVRNQHENPKKYSDKKIVDWEDVR